MESCANKIQNKDIRILKCFTCKNPRLKLKWLFPFSEEYVPGAARKGMEWQYFVGDCSDPAVQQQAKENFIRGFNEVFSPKDPNYCQREKICALENIKITCGEVQRRRRRNAQVNSLFIYRQFSTIKSSIQ